MKARNSGCAVVLAGLLAGCAVGPDYQTPDGALPVAFLSQPAIKQPATGGASPDLWQWWRTLHDPQLNDLIERALRNNLDLKIALDRLQQARLQLVVIGGQALPELNGSAGGGVGTGTDETKGRAAEALRAGDNSAGLRSITRIGREDCARGKERGAEFAIIRADANYRILKSFTQQESPARQTAESPAALNRRNALRGFRRSAGPPGSKQ